MHLVDFDMYFEVVFNQWSNGGGMGTTEDTNSGGTMGFHILGHKLIQMEILFFQVVVQILLHQIIIQMHVLMMVLVSQLLRDVQIFRHVIIILMLT